MNCPNCNNPIQDNARECEWCGFVISKPNTDENRDIYPDELSSREQKNLQPLSENRISNTTQVSSNPIRLLFFAPGFTVFIIWVIGNLISERDKRAIFDMDDLSPVLFISIGLTIFGFILLWATKKR